MRIPDAVLLFFALAGCGGGVGVDGRVVGGACPEENCAPGSACVIDSDFPGEMCTIPCTVADPAACPAGTACVDKKGGLCLPTCQFHQDCRPGYECKDEELIGAKTKALVCIK